MSDVLLRDYVHSREAACMRAMDVYEQEADLVFRDLSNEIITGDFIQRIVLFPNVNRTVHQVYALREALPTMYDTTPRRITAFERNGKLENEVKGLIATGCLRYSVGRTTPTSLETI